MTKIDYDLLFIYSEDSRRKIKEISTILQKTPQRLNYSLDILKEKRFIFYPHTVFDYSFFGLILFRIYFKGGYVSERDKGRIISRLEQNPYVTAIYELSGEYDLTIDMQAPNPSRFNKELKHLVTDIPTLNNYSIVLNIVTHLYPRLYFIKKAKVQTAVPQHIIIGGDRKTEQFSETEMKIMEAFLEHPLIRYAKIASESAKNIKTVMHAYRELKKRMIIRGFKIIVNTNQLDIHTRRLFLKFHNMSQEREQELMEYFMKTREVVQVSKTVGDWEMEVDIESFKMQRIRFLIIELREEFKDLIQTFNVTEFYQYHKRQYLPRFIFDESDEKEKKERKQTKE
jgi:DNA-binding Lrp family transcriptional regulator